MIIGFTGTRKGMSERQKAALKRWIWHYVPLEFHHGFCVGGDEEASLLMKEIPIEATVVGHPPIKPDLRSLRAYCDVLLPAKAYLDRDHDIVDACDVLLAAPDGPERPHSGTWYTIKYAYKQLKPVIVLLP